MPATAQQVAAFLGRAGDPTVVAQAEAHLPIVRTFVAAYVRDVGFTAGVENDALGAVVVSACARLVTNPSQARQYAAGDYSESPGLLNGWTLPELAVLHRYRRRAL